MPSSSTTVVQSSGQAIIAWGCPRCQLGRTSSIAPDEAVDALEGGARTAGLCMIVFKQCGGCDTLTALPLRAFTAYVDADGTLIEWHCLVCSCANSFSVGTDMLSLLRHQGATLVVTDLAEVTE